MKSNKKILFFLLLTEFVMFSCNAKEVKANPITDFILKQIRLLPKLQFTDMMENL